ncbi:Aste57867_16211 [Aphanomyces stellatus]|uniref:Aste57867_16211 protein n=1 Tax=Aphanomyces stellatus TaxID=120398 RepID=A0A485L856_9STRA|nr:hypothetical protein As57867_016154 [Aphanomyces stellatus]VFT92989.1 Aste57867_16211 [Aphanomyces stellatus]
MTATPLWSYGVLVVAVLAMSSGGVWFALLTETPPLMQACWRLVLTVALQLGGFVHELRTDPSLDAAFWRRFWRSSPLLLTIGLALGVHFGSWGWSVAHTSLLDSLLLVCSTPLLLVVIMTLRWLYRRHDTSTTVVHLARESDRLLDSITTAADDGASWFRTVVCPKISLPPTLHEAIGALVGFAGVIVLLATSTERSVHQVTLAGNAAALLGALAILVYLEGGAGCRKWMPLFVYALPVTAIAALELAIASLVFEAHTTIGGVGPTALFGFLGDGRRFGLAFGAAAVSGLLGHTCANLAVKYVSPLLISVAVLWEPLLGSVMGYMVGVQGPPDASAVIAAPLLLGGALLVTLGGRRVITAKDEPKQVDDRRTDDRVALSA